MADENQSEFVKFDHLVVLMLENHSFDNMLGWLYSPNNPPPYDHSPIGQERFDGLGDGSMFWNPLDRKTPPTRKYVFPIGEPLNPQHARHSLPDPNPGENYIDVNWQLFDAGTPPVPPIATNKGFVLNYATVHELSRKHSAGCIMGCYAPEAVNVLSELARSFAVCDRWFCSVPSQTWSNRRFTHAATAVGNVDNTPVLHDSMTIFDLLPSNQWKIFMQEPPLTLSGLLFPHLLTCNPRNFRSLKEFKRLVRSGDLPAYSFLEPRYFIEPTDQHPSHSVPAGEQLIADVYNSLVDGPRWNRTLLLITYDEHGGCYDHVHPPCSAAAPDDYVGSSGFDFRRYGVRVPAVLVSPYIPRGTILRTGQVGVEFDHTSIIKTLRNRFRIGKALSRRDEAAPSFEKVLSLGSPRDRTDIPLHLAPKHRSAVTDSSDEPLTPMQRDMVRTAANLYTLDRAGSSTQPSVPVEAEEAVNRIRTVREARDYVAKKLEGLAGVRIR